MDGMRFTPAEVRFLNRQTRGHLATLGLKGTPQVKPLGFSYNLMSAPLNCTVST